MKRILLILALFPALAFGQNVRWDLPITTTQAQGGNLLPVYAVPGALVSFYNSPAGTLANTYNSATSTSPCPSGSQVVLNGSAACTSSADPYGNMGAWFQSGQYYATIIARGQSYNYYFTIGGGSGAGVSSLNTLTGALTLTISGYTCSASGTTIACTTQTPFTINSFSGCAGTVELGANIVNPAFTASYSATPSSAAITNTDGIASPTNLSPPYTSQTVTGTFSHSAVATTTFTLTASNGTSTPTSTCTDNWKPRIFGGVAATGATSTVTASGTTAVLSNSTAITSAGLGAETVGQVIGSYTPSGQAIYLLLTGSSHTFTDNNTGLPMAFNAPITVTFTNVNGVTVTMYLYQTTNSLYANFQPKVAS